MINAIKQNALRYPDLKIKHLLLQEAVFLSSSSIAQDKDAVLPMCEGTKEN